MGKEITRNEAIALRAAAQVAVQLADQMLQKMDASLVKRKNTSIVTPEYLAQQRARREKTLMKSFLKSAQKNPQRKQ